MDRDKVNILRRNAIVVLIDTPSIRNVGMDSLTRDTGVSSPELPVQETQTQQSIDIRKDVQVSGRGKHPCDALKWFFFCCSDCFAFFTSCRAPRWGIYAPILQEQYAFFYRITSVVSNVIVPNVYPRH